MGWLGVCYSLQSNTLLVELTNKWDTIRRFLPPTFSGKYDKHQFEVFLQANLLILGFLSLCTGFVLAVQVRPCCRSRNLVVAAISCRVELRLWDLGRRRA